MSSTTLIPVPQRIATQLRAEVRQGVYPPGAPLREEHLATKFGVSRSPIRQVLQQLTHEGLLHSRPNCGTVVAAPPSVEVMEVLRDCRARLECLALRACFDQLEDRDWQRWETILGELYSACEANDPVAAYLCDMRFHQVLIDKAAPAGAMGVYSVIAGASIEFLSVNENRPNRTDLRELYAIHAALLAMFRMGDQDLAREALVQHITGGTFVSAAAETWVKAGKPMGVVAEYATLAEPLRRCAVERALGAGGAIC